ncbi:right-handed parallel beta-helix repeat-containing protein [Paenibacillus thermoaerophilus]|uniref:Right-handed parallel beta-helix repeat-containing protein n=1 Tax=Paenibacillus thermoaerophilus TaxID=1215385 RepID=A0ABW2V660_9BACL|nr:right-handed parallel beta-helix repeat-containing protein [Paenibacillus thermoaerophilus]TMV11163.1 DUF1565 domain-containing protein [Paenibacillus thermoaerophilus]
MIKRLDHVRMMKAGFLLLMTIMILSVSAPLSAFSGYQAPGKVYYVASDGNDSNPGTKDAPWRTIQKAADTLIAGETVLVREGVYKEFVSIRSSGSAADGYIVFQAYPGERPVIDGSELDLSGGESALVQLRGVSFVVVDGFEIRNLRSSQDDQYPAGIRVQYGGTNIHILNNDVHHIENVSSGGNAHGIHVYGNSALSLKNVRVSGNRVHHLVLGSSESLTLSGNIDGFVVENNVIHDNNNIGIDIAGYYGACSLPCIDQARNGIVAGNTVYNIDSSDNPAYGGGSNSAGGIYADGAANVVIERNQVYRSGFGIEIASENRGKTTSRITVRSNYLHHNDGAGIIIGGSSPSNGGAADNLIANNTLIENDQRRQGYGEIAIQENSTGNIIVNNLIYGMAGQPFVSKYNISGSGNRFDYNLYYRPDGADGVSWSWQGQTYKTWEAYKQATGHDGNSIFADPKLADRSQDIRLTEGSPAIDRGADVYAARTDYDFFGQNRIVQTAVDIGAAEYGGDSLPAQQEPSPSPEPQPIPSPAPGPIPETQPNPNPEPTDTGGRFTVDGDFSDWDGVAELAVGHSNVRSVKSAIAEGQLYVLVTGNLLSDKGQLYLNTDGNPETGFQAPYWNGIGADYLLENGVLYRYSGEGGTNWGWTEIRSYRKSGKFVATSTVVEVSIDLSDLGMNGNGPVDMGYVWKDSYSHKLPGGSTPLKVGGAVQPGEPELPAPAPGIVLDGSSEDWAGIEPLVRSESNPRLLKVDNDSEYLYLLVEGSALLTKTQIYLNTDGSAATGYTASDLVAGGAEYLLEYGRLYRYTGKGSNWSWRQISNLKRAQWWLERDDLIEAAVPLSELGVRIGSPIAIGVHKDDNRLTQLPVSGDMAAYTLQ